MCCGLKSGGKAPGHVLFLRWWSRPVLNHGPARASPFNLSFNSTCDGDRNSRAHDNLPRVQGDNPPRRSAGLPTSQTSAPSRLPRGQRNRVYHSVTPNVKKIAVVGRHADVALVLVLRSHVTADPPHSVRVVGQNFIHRLSTPSTSPVLSYKSSHKTCKQNLGLEDADYSLR